MPPQADCPPGPPGPQRPCAAAHVPPRVGDDAPSSPLGDGSLLARLPDDLRDDWLNAKRQLLESMSIHLAAEERILARLVERTGSAGGVLQSGGEVLTTDAQAPAVDSALVDPRSGVEAQGDGAKQAKNASEASDGVEPTADGAQGAIASDGAQRTASRKSMRSSQSMGTEALAIFRQELEEAGIHQKVLDLVAAKMEWWVKLREPPRNLDRSLAVFIRGPYWTMLVTLAIFLNAAYMTQYVDFQLRRYRAGSSPPGWMHGVEWGFTVFFLVDLLLKLGAHGMWFFCNHEMGWNMFDLVVVVLSFVDLLSQEGSNATFMRALRILRVVRALRVLRYMKELRRMFMSLLASMRLLFWGLVVALFVLLLFSVAVVQAVATFFEEAESGSLSEASEQMVVQHFGTVSRTMFTLFSSMTGGANWNDYYYPLSETGPFAELLYVAALVFLQIVLVNILTGVFVDEAMKLSLPDQEQRALEKRREDAKLADELRHLLEDLDEDQNGVITWEEFKHLNATKSKVKALLATMGLDITDTEQVFLMVATKDQPHVHIDTLCSSLLRLRGQATSIDLNALLLRVQSIEQKLGSTKYIGSAKM